MAGYTYLYTAGVRASYFLGVIGTLSRKTLIPPPRLLQQQVRLVNSHLFHTNVVREYYNRIVVVVIEMAYNNIVR